MSHQSWLERPYQDRAAAEELFEHWSELPATEELFDELVADGDVESTVAFNDWVWSRQAEEYFEMWADEKGRV